MTRAARPPDGRSIVFVGAGPGDPGMLTARAPTRWPQAGRWSSSTRTSPPRVQDAVRDAARRAPS